MSVALLVRFFFFYVVFTQDTSDRWEERDGQTVTLEGYITAKDDGEKSRRFDLSDRLIVYDTSFTDVPIGGRVRVIGELSCFQEQRNPGGFDEAQYYSRKGYEAKLAADRIIVLDDTPDRWKETLYRIRNAWADGMSDALGSTDGGILAAMTLGKKNGMDADEKEWYQKAGFGHLMAVSGCHVSLVAVLLRAFCRRIRLPNALTIAFTGAVLYLYVLLCQAPVSAVRAYLTYMVFLGAKLFGRVYQGKRTLFLAAVVVLIYRPQDIADAGFLLSFGAMTGVWYVAPVLQKRLPKRFPSGISLSVAVQSVLLPALLYYFYEVPVYGLLFGVAAVGMFGALMFFGSAGCIVRSLMLIPFPYAGEWAGRLFARISEAVWQPAGWILSVYRAFCRAELSLPMARWVAGRPSVWQIVLYYTLLVLLLFLLQNIQKKRILAGFLALPLCFLALPEKGVVSFTMLDVGQGDGFFLEGPEGVSYLFDGGSSDQTQLAKYTLEPYVKYRGIDTIDYAFLSHGDQDHISGVQEMLERQQVGVRIRNLVLPARAVWDDALTQIAYQARQSGVRVLVMDAGDCLTEGDLTIRALYPEEGTDAEPGNAASLVLDIRYRDFSVLMTGDLEEGGEQKLLEAGCPGGYTILKAGHHGSKTSSSAAFLESVSPKYAFLSVGEDNWYGHPHREVLERLAAYGIQTTRTDENGAVEVVTDGDKIRINAAICPEQ